MTVSPPTRLASFQQLDPDLSLIALGRGQSKGPGGAVGSEEAVQAKTPKEARMRGTAPVVGGVGQGRAPRRLRPGDLGVLRGLLVDGDLITADFGLSASNPLPTDSRGINHLGGSRPS